jgi:hypothetical protein
MNGRPTQNAIDDEAGQRAAASEQAAARSVDALLRNRLRAAAEVPELLARVRPAVTLLGFRSWGAYVRDLMETDLSALPPRMRYEVLRALCASRHNGA